MQSRLSNEIKEVWLAENILEIIETMIGFGIVYFVLITFVAKNLVNLFLMIWAILFTSVVVFNIVQILLIPCVYNFWTYQITGGYMVLHKGYISRKQITVPLARLQIVTPEAGSLLCWQHLTKLHLHTTSFSEEIPGSRLEDARLSKKQLLNIIRKAGDKHD